ncbi:MAG: HAMP domain-containing histidine kinase [Candidatus Parcubacteria bacterium]|nr:HAMP domain-containing histidine kinase [Candidatus Paceibacterota bacterium]
MTPLQHIADLVTGSKLSPQFKKLRLIITALIFAVVGLVLVCNGFILASNLYRGNQNIRKNNQDRLPKISSRENPPCRSGMCPDPIRKTESYEEYEKNIQNDLKQKIEQETFQTNFLILIILTVLSYLALYYLLKPLSDGIIQREDFVARASHELRTPLAILYSELSLGSVLTKIEPIQQILAESKDEVKRLQNLANNLLNQDSHQIYPSQLEDFIPSNAELIQTIWNRLTKSNPNQQEFKISIQELNQQDWNVMSANRRALIEELFWNLLDNSLKHGDNSQPVIIEAQDNQIIISNSKKLYKLEKERSQQKTQGLKICQDICTELYWWAITIEGGGDKFVVRINVA